MTVTAEDPQMLRALLLAGPWDASTRERLVRAGAAAVGPLTDALADPRPPVREVAAHALVALGTSAAVVPLLRAAHAHLEQTDLVVWALRGALPHVGPAQARTVAPLVAKCIGHASPLVRTAALDLAAVLQSAALVPSIEAALRDADLGVASRARNAAWRTLGVGDDDVRTHAALLDALDSATPQSMATATAAILASPARVPVLMAALQGPDGRLVDRSLAVAAQLPRADAQGLAGPLIARIDAATTPDHCRALALRALDAGAVPDLADAARWLGRYARSSDVFVRAAAAWALSRVGHPEAASLLAALREDPDEWVVEEAKAAARSASAP